ncbi:hypothetical protein [Saccharomonospora sp. NB11]|jgi:hypothetical protein|uniref:hypothetical protein n=1 Tax=Saccharomonospora sp. NB11 TaxID=1642298 RepID=UPI0018D116F1|nr:hypothetical protein [Saccharomonospora sp. NB11]
MSTTVTALPVPIRCTLPDGWLSVPPKEVNADNAAFVAVHPGLSKGFTPSITMTGHVRAHDAPLQQVAEESLAELRAGATEVRVGERSEVGTVDNPGFAQAVRLVVPYGGKPLHLVQRQAFFSMNYPPDPGSTAVLQVVLSALPDQFVRLLDEFHEFLTTIRPEVER